MAVYRYPPEVHEFVKKWSPRLRDRDLAEECNKACGTSFTAASMKAFRGNHKYWNGQKQYSKEEYWKYQTRYPQGMYEFVRDNSWGISSIQMAEMVNEKFGTNFTQTMMKQFRQRHGIKSGVTGWYQKGHPPGNKGKKLEDYLSQERAAEVRKKIAKTQFKKGERPINELPVGTIVINSDGYKLRKKQMEGTIWERWEHLHRAVWEENNGPIPDGMCITFKNGNRSDCRLENLIMISRSESATLTGKGYRFEDPDLTETAINMIRLQKAASKKRKAKKK